MQIINDALQPEQLDIMRKFFAKEEPVSLDERARTLDAQLRARADLQAEAADRARHAAKAGAR